MVALLNIPKEVLYNIAYHLDDYDFRKLIFASKTMCQNILQINDIHKKNFEGTYAIQEENILIHYQRHLEENNKLMGKAFSFSKSY